MGESILKILTDRFNPTIIQNKDATFDASNTSINKPFITKAKIKDSVPMEKYLKNLSFSLKSLTIFFIISIKIKINTAVPSIPTSPSDLKKSLSVAIPKDE